MASIAPNTDVKTTASPAAASPAVQPLSLDAELDKEGGKGTESKEKPKQDKVKLISADGHEFVVDKPAVMASGTIRTMLTGPGRWKENQGPIPTVTFPEIPTSTLEKVIEYFYYKQKYDAQPNRPPFEIKLEEVTQLLVAANYLDC